MDASYQLLAARYVRRQTRQLVGQFDGVRNADDIEFVHRARVASRRLRAALGIFRECFARKKVKRWRKRIRQVTEGLGAARDKDVQIEFVRGVLAGLEDKACRPGIARLLLRLQQGRRAIQPKAVEAIDRFQKSGVADEMLAAAKGILSKLKRRDVSLQSPFAGNQAEGHILSRLNQLTDYEDCLANPQDIQQHHAMRIAAKRLRYTMEICEPIYEGGLDEFIQAVKHLQSLLGDVHDCDVWGEDLGRFLDEERERTLAYFGQLRPFARLEIGIEYLRQERQNYRTEVFQQLVENWRAVNEAALWERLVRRVQSPFEPSVGSELPTGTPAPETESQPKSPPGCHGNHTGDGEGQAPPTTEQAAEPVKPDGRTARKPRALLGAGRPEEPG